MSGKARRMIVVGAIAGTAVLGAIGGGQSFAAKSSDPEASFLDDQIPLGSDAAGRHWNLGGFSALAPIGASGKEYWSLTDRGPNDDTDRSVGGSLVNCTNNPSPAGKAVFLPAFNPEIDKLGVRNGGIHVQERIPLHDGAHGATGKPNLTGDEATYTRDANGSCTALPSSGGVIDPFGVDTEGIVVDPRDGTFWVSDEYRPSLIHVASDGQILSRLVPQDLSVDATLNLDTATRYANSVTAAGGSLAVKPVFPGVVNGFRKNRGFEGVALSPDGQTLYTLLQSPMDYRTAWGSSRVSGSQRDAARNGPIIRVFKMDISNPSAPALQAEWIYLLNRGFANPGVVPDKISDVQYLGPDQLLIEERDDDRPTNITDFYRADFSAATNLLTASQAIQDVANKKTAPMLEMFTQSQFNATGIVPASSPLAIDFDQLLFGAGFTNSKIEGTAFVRATGSHPTLFAGVNDNDFDLDHTIGVSASAIPEQVDVFPQP
jgi:Esterase-like activity of phytase